MTYASGRNGDQMVSKSPQVARPAGTIANLADQMLPWSCLAAAIAFWLASLPLIDTQDLGQLGLLTAMPWTMAPAFALVAIGFVLTLRAKVKTGLAPYVMIIMFVVLLHGTAAIVYDNLRYSWAWKHLGVIDFIQRTGTIDQYSRYLAAYHNWPGFFLVFANIGKIFEIDPLEMSQIARFFPLGLNLLYASILPYIFRRLSTDRRFVWTATALFIVGNWVGQDYFSPQGTVFFLLLIVLALCLGPLASIPPRPPANAHPLRFVFWRLQLWSTRRTPVLPQRLPTAHQVTAVVTVLVLILAITASHQLTPILMIAMFAGLFAIGRLSIGFLLFAIAAEMLWLFFIADPFMGQVLPAMIGEFGTIGDATFGAVVDWRQVSDGQRLVSLASRSVVVVIVLAAMAGCLLRLRHGYRDGIAAVLALAPVPLAISTSYGGEILFRVYFFMLPFLAFFAAGLLFPHPKSRFTAFKATALALFLSTLCGAFILANNGKDAQYAFTDGEVAAAKWIYADPVPDTLLIEAATNYPMQFQNYENFIYVPLSEELRTSLNEVLTDPARLLASWLRTHDGPAAYAIFTRSHAAFYEAMSLLPGSSLPEVVDKLMASPDLKVAFAAQDAIVFEAVPVPSPAMSPDDIVRQRYQLEQLMAFGGFGSSGLPISRDHLAEREQERLIDALRDAGYHEAVVTLAPASGSGETAATYEIEVDAGPIYTIGTVRLHGIDTASSGELPQVLTDLVMRAPGEPATRMNFDSLMNVTTWLLGQSGYPFAQARLGTLDLHAETRLVTMEIVIETGTRATIGTTSVEGVWERIDPAILGDVPLPTDEPYSPDRISILYEALSALPTVAQVWIELVPVTDSVINVAVGIDPAPRFVPSGRDIVGLVLLAILLIIIGTREGLTATEPRLYRTAIGNYTIATVVLGSIAATYVLIRLLEIMAI